MLKRKKGIKIILLTFGFLGLIIFLIYGHIYSILPDVTYHFLENVTLPQTNDRIVIFSPHPDDETLGAGGLIQKAIKTGAAIKVVIVTDGNKHHEKLLRHHESLMALDILGLSETAVQFLNLPDGRANTYSDLDQKLWLIVKEFQPTIIVTTHPADHHPDHSAVGRAVKKMLTLHPEFKPRLFEYLIHYPRYPRPIGFHPNYHLIPPVRLITSDKQWFKLDLSQEEQTKKHQAIKQYKTQLTIENPVLRSLLLDFDRKNELFQIDE